MIPYSINVINSILFFADEFDRRDQINVAADWTAGSNHQKFELSIKIWELCQ